MNIHELVSGLHKMRAAFPERPESSDSNSSVGPTDFSSGLKLPKLDSEFCSNDTGSVKMDSKNKKVKDELAPNMKIRKFKELHNKSIMSGTGPLAEDAGVVPTRAHTGLFNSSNAFYENDNSVDEDDDETTTKIKTFIKKHKKNSKLDQEIQSRISNAYQKMETLEKGFKSMDSTMLAAKERVQTNLVKSPKFLSETFSSTSSLLEDWQAKKETAKSEQDSAIGLTEKDFISSKSSKAEGAFGKTTDAGLYLPSSKGSGILSPEIHSVKNKRFLATHQRRGARLNKEIAGIKNRLELENSKNNTKGVKDKILSTKSKPSFTPNANGTPPKQISRLVDYDGNKGPTKEFTDFLQSNGGLTGGWGKAEHNNFLKNYIKLKSSPTKLIDIVAKDCPGKTVQEVAAHLEWYQKYLQLNESSKEYIREWDLRKRRDRQTMFQMAKEDQKAKLEGERSHQEMLKFRREQEKIRQKDNLEAWKKSMESKLKDSKAEEAKTVDEKLDEIDNAVANSKLLTPNKNTGTENVLISAKLREDIKATKEKLVQILPKTHQAHKVLAKIGTSGPTIPRRRQSSQTLYPSKPKVEAGILSRSADWKDYMKPTSASLSSGIFSDYSEDVKPKEIFTFQHGLEYGDTLPKTDISLHPDINKVVTEAGDASIRAKELPIPAHKLITKGLAAPVRRGTNPKLVKMFQARDAELVEARKTAILHKKEQQMNKANLSVDKVRERLNKLDVPSQIQQLTKGLKIRHSIKELEAVEAETRAVKRQDVNEYHKLSRVSTPNLFKTDPSIRNVAKLGVPAWRNG